MTALALALGVVLLALNGAFVALQFALVASRRSVLERLGAEGDRRAARVAAPARALDLRLSGAQLGITAASLALGAVAVPALADVLAPALDPLDLRRSVERGLAAAAALAAVVVLHVVAGELVPKRLAISRPERVLLALSGIEWVWAALLGPVVRALDATARRLAGLLGARPPRTSAHTAEELARLLAESRRHGLLEQTAHDLLAGALDLGGRVVASIVVPAERITSVPSTATVADAEAAVAASGATRLLVRGPGGTVVGYVRVRELLAVPPDARHRPLPLARIRRVLVVGPQTPLDTVLVAMRRSRTPVATVVDGGRFCGIATLEDVLASVVDRAA